MQLTVRRTCGHEAHVGASPQRQPHYICDWIATASLGYDPSGKRIVKRGSGKTKTEAKTKLKEVLRDYEDGLAIAPADYTVERAVNDWLAYGLNGRDPATINT